ncbi:MAG: sigma-70 family RNA polymerase sigma factor [Parcubacteria group bacterium]|nr:sigma-70 family RNA polymerase sigma factor [Parcubacteria group bacterium]
MNQDEFSKFYKDNLDKVFRFIYFRVDKTETAQDITSQVFLKYWQTNGEAREKIKNPQAFVYQIARNQIIDFYRRQKTKVVSLDELAEQGIEIPQTSFAFKIELSLEMENLKKAIQRLKPEYSEIIIWHYIDNLSTKEIAAILNKKENNIRVLLHRALESLKKECNTLS